jgi:hypothetical protein
METEKSVSVSEGDEGDGNTKIFLMGFFRQRGQQGTGAGGGDRRETEEKYQTQNRGRPIGKDG